MAQGDELRGLKILIQARMEDAFYRWANDDARISIQFAADRLMRRDKISKREEEFVTTICRARRIGDLEDACTELYALHQDGINRT